MRTCAFAISSLMSASASLAETVVFAKIAGAVRSEKLTPKTRIKVDKCLMAA